MTRAYELSPDKHFHGVNSIEAVHARKLPGIRCPECGVWALTGFIYPSVDPMLLNDAALPQLSWPISVADFKRVAGMLEPILGEDRPIAPGTDLGPLRGIARGVFGDFAWVNPWTPLLHESAWRGILQAGVCLQGVGAVLNWRGEANEPLVELEARPKVSLAHVEQLPCDTCGRLPVKRPEEVVLLAASYDDSIPLQRITELPTVLIANEALVQYIQANSLRDVAFKPVRLS